MHSGYSLRRVLRNMRQSPVLCIAAVGTVAVSLTILSFFAIIVLNLQKLTGHWSKEIQVVAYIEVPPDQKRVEGWLSEIRQFPQVEEVAYVSSEEAFERFRKRLAQDSDLLTGLEPEILPGSLEISLKEGARNRLGVEAVVSRLRQDGRFADLRYGQDWLERFDAFVDLLRLAGAVLGGFLLFAALFIVSNTIKLTLYARRDELEIMALVGATPFFIKAPFLLEGALHGALGGLLALSGSYLLFSAFVREGLSAVLLASGLDGITFLTPGFQLLLLGAGIMLGFVGSLLSLRKFVRI